MQKLAQIAATAIVASGLMVATATAQTGADFYKDKTVSYIVSTARQHALCVEAGSRCGVRK